MSTNTRRILLSCAALAVAACLCLAAISASGLGVFLFSNQSVTATLIPTLTASLPPKPSATSQVSIEPSPTTSIGLAPSPTASPTLSSLVLSPLISQQMDEIQAQVESYRGLHLSSPVVRGVLTSDQLQQKVVTEFLNDYTQADSNQDAQILSTFGLVPSTFDFLSFQKNFLSEQIAGYYDDTTKEMYVVSDEGFQGLQRFNYAHEYTHVLQDQNYDFQGKLGYSEEKCQLDSERCAAIQALIEGDATLSQEVWLFTFATSLDRQQITAFSQTYQSPVFDSAPEFYKDDAMFPYSQGLEFVQTLYDQGGWQAIDNAYLNPPVSTEQILHPELYPDDKPVTVNLPDLTSALGTDWKQIDKDTVGEWYTYLILAAGYDPADRLPDKTAKQAAAGWGGDSYAIYANTQTNGLALVVVWQWDTTNDAGEFWNAFNQYGTDRWGNSSSSTTDTTQWDNTQNYASISISGKTTTWILAPDSQTADTIASNLSN